MINLNDSHFALHNQLLQTEKCPLLSIFFVLRMPNVIKYYFCLLLHQILIDDEVLSMYYLKLAEIMHFIQKTLFILKMLVNFYFIQQIKSRWMSLHTDEWEHLNDKTSMTMHYEEVPNCGKTIFSGRETVPLGWGENEFVLYSLSKSVFPTSWHSSSLFVKRCMMGPLPLTSVQRGWSYLISICTSNCFFFCVFCFVLVCATNSVLLLDVAGVL